MPRRSRPGRKELLKWNKLKPEVIGNTKIFKAPKWKTVSATKAKIPLNKYQVKTTGVTPRQASNIRFRPISQKLHIGDIGYRTITKATKLANTARRLEAQGFTNLNPH